MHYTIIVSSLFCFNFVIIILIVNVNNIKYNYINNCYFNNLINVIFLFQF